MARHPLTSTLDFQSGIADTVDEGEVEVYRKTGDFAIRERLIMSHTRIALGMASRRARARAIDSETLFLELASVGFTALTQAVVWAGPHTDEQGLACPSRLTDNNITPYLRSSIRRRIFDFIAEDRTVFMPGRTFRAKAASGEIDPTGHNLRPEIVGVVSVLRLIIEDVSRGTECEEGILNSDVPTTIPVAKPDQPDQTLLDALDFAIHTEQERRIIDLRREGYRYREIGEVLGLSVARISQIISPVEERLLKAYA